MDINKLKAFIGEKKKKKYNLSLTVGVTLIFGGLINIIGYANKIHMLIPNAFLIGAFVLYIAIYCIYEKKRKRKPGIVFLCVALQRLSVLITIITTYSFCIFNIYIDSKESSIILVIIVISVYVATSIVSIAVVNRELGSKNSTGNKLKKTIVEFTPAGGGVLGFIVYKLLPNDLSTTQLYEVMAIALSLLGTVALPMIVEDIMKYYYTKKYEVEESVQLENEEY
ncbi:MAG: hypothetical protein VB031_05920 [Eubacteriaceae bacterium]|nr:hypothetical protein [Eubacteriaceae bacterium]